MIPNDENTPAVPRRQHRRRQPRRRLRRRAPRHRTTDAYGEQVEPAPGEPEATDEPGEEKPDTDAPVKAVDPPSCAPRRGRPLRRRRGLSRAAKISLVLGRPASQIREILVDIAREYETVGRGFRLEEIAGGCRCSPTRARRPHQGPVPLGRERQESPRPCSRPSPSSPTNSPSYAPTSRLSAASRPGAMLRAASWKRAWCASRAAPTSSAGRSSTAPPKNSSNTFGLRSLKDLPEIEELRPAPDGE